MINEKQRTKKAKTNKTLRNPTMDKKHKRQKKIETEKRTSG